MGSGGGVDGECGAGADVCVARTGWFVLPKHTGAKLVHLTDSKIYAIMYLRLDEEDQARSDMRSFFDNGIGEKLGPRDHCKRRWTRNPGRLSV